MPRINITVGEKVDEKLKEYCEFMGMTKSGLCAYIVANNVMQMQNVTDSINKSFDEVIKSETKKK